MDTPGETDPILIVDDETCIREMIDSILKSGGYRTAQAGHGLTALGLIRKSRFSLILLDLHMPELGGHEFIVRLEQMRNEGCPTLEELPPIVVVSGYTEELALWQEALQGQIACMLPKPFGPTKLLRVVQDVLAGRTIYVST